MYRILRISVAVILVAIAADTAYMAGRNLGHGSAQQLGGISRLIAEQSMPGNMGTVAMADPSTASKVPPREVFQSIIDRIHRRYVRDYGGNSNLSNGALAGMVAALNDPFTSYLTPGLCSARKQSLAGTYHGIGADLVITRQTKNDVDYDYLTVEDTAPGGPAAMAGLKPGDHITNIDGHWVIAYSILADVARIVKEKNKDAAAKQAELDPIATRFQAGYSLPKSLRLLTEGTGTNFKITFTRNGVSAPTTVTLTTAVTAVKPAEFTMQPGSIAYLKIREFNRESTNVVDAALPQIKQSKGLILDLRDNSGGVISASGSGIDGYGAALHLISVLGKGGHIATIEKKPGNFVQVSVATSAGVGVPVAILINHGTANLAEMAAENLHNKIGASLVGTRSFGNSILQLFAPLDDGGALQIDTAHIASLDGKGLKLPLQPTVALRPADADGTAAITRAQSLL